MRFKLVRWWGQSVLEGRVAPIYFVFASVSFLVNLGISFLIILGIKFLDLTLIKLEQKLHSASEDLIIYFLNLIKAKKTVTLPLWHVFQVNSVYFVTRNVTLGIIRMYGRPLFNFLDLKLKKASRYFRLQIYRIKLILLFFILNFFLIKDLTIVQFRTFFLLWIRHHMKNTVPNFSWHFVCKSFFKPTLDGFFWWGHFVEMEAFESPRKRF